MEAAEVALTARIDRRAGVTWCASEQKVGETWTLRRLSCTPDLVWNWIWARIHGLHACMHHACLVHVHNHDIR
jgi:hypothetical protein